MLEELHGLDNMTMDMNIAYQFCFSVIGEGKRVESSDFNALKKAISQNFNDVLYYDKNLEPQPNAFLRDLKICENFLHGGGLPFACTRIILNDYDIKFERFETASSKIFLNVFPETDTAQLFICLSLKNIKPDEAIYIRHCQSNGALLLNKDGGRFSINALSEKIINALDTDVDDLDKKYYVEVKRFGDYEDINEIQERFPELIYAMMCGDEGFRNVPRDMVVKRLENSWGSREFIRLYAFGGDSLFFNLADCKIAKEYREFRRQFDHSFYGDMNPYFLLDSDVAGVNHGVLFALELVSNIKTLCNRILRHQAAYNAANSTRITKDISKVKLRRGELLSTLKRTENLAFSELGQMEHLIMASQDIEPLIEKLKYLLELVESELSLLYETSNNRFIAILTVAGILISGLSFLLSYVL